MILKLIRHCEPWRVGLLLLGSVLLPMMAMAVVGEPLTPFLASGAVLCPMLLMLGRPALRATPFEAGLPIAARRLFVARTAYRLTLVLAFAATCLIAAVKRADPGMVADVLGVAALATLALLLPQSIRPRELKVSGAPIAITWVAVAAGGALAWYLLPAGYALSLFAVGIIAAFSGAWARTPTSYQIASTEVGGHSPTTAITHASTSPSSSPTWLRWQPVVRSVCTWPVLVSALLMAMQGYLGFSIYTLCINGGLIAQVVSGSRMRWTLGLPFSHWTRFAIVLVVIAAPLFVGYTVGASIPSSLRDAVASVGSGPDRFADGTWNFSKTNVPLQYWRLAPHGVVPVIRSPWGETTRTPTLSIPGFTFYNPYQAAKGNTQEFLNWQWARATTAVNGHAVSFADYETYPGRHIPVTRQPRMRILSTAALVVFELYLSFLVLLPAWYRVHRPSGRVLPIVASVLCTTPAAAAVGAEFLLNMRGGGNVVVPLVLKLLLHVSEALPENLTVVTIVAAIPVVAVGWLLERQISRSEFVGYAQPGVAS